MPASKTLISRKMASLSSSMVHSNAGWSLAKFCLVSTGSFPSIIGTSKVP